MYISIPTNVVLLDLH